MSLTHETAEWADGPRLCAWLQEKDINPHHFGAFGRRATDWRRGAAADFYTVDRLLCAAGWHPSDLPESVWRDAPLRVPRPGRVRRIAQSNRGGPVKLSAELALEIRREVRGGASQGGLARRYGVSRKTISNVVNGSTWRAAA